MRKLTNHLLLALVVGFLLGLLWIFAIRFVTVRNDDTHYHANFGVFINGERIKFDNFTYYEEVQSCSGDYKNNPRVRTHMHDEVSHVVHVHDEAATWGHFMANLGFVLGNELIKTDTGLYVDGEGGDLEFLLNGQPTKSIANQTIGDEDVLLISYGETDEENLREQYDAITKDAAEYNLRNDPSACSGGKPLSLSQRFKAALGLEY